MKRTYSKGAQWLFPEEAEIQLIKKEQIIARNVSVRYSLTVAMRCYLDDKQVQDIEGCYEELLDIS